MTTLHAIPHWTEVPDFFVWEAFDLASRDRTHRLGADASQQEALLAETTNFYLIPDQFGVVSGHVLVIPKSECTSIAAVSSQFDDEITWLLEHVSQTIAFAYDAQVVVAEHGECGCATAGQAHIHVLPIPATITPTQLRTIVDRVLQRRMIGIERIIYRDVEFTALEDLRALIDVDGATVVGRQLQVSDFLDRVVYPATARSAGGLSRPYVYFSGPGVEFLSSWELRSQFVREVVALAAGLPSGSWDRRVNTSRDNMFATFERLSSSLRDGGGVRHGFEARAGI